MSHVLTLDADGRLPLPAEFRLRHHLRSGSRLRLAENAGQIVLEPIDSTPSIRAVLVEEDGLPLIRGVPEGPVPDHREIREERLGRLSEPGE